MAARPLTLELAGALALLAAPQLAEAAQIAEPRFQVSVNYDGALWSAKLGDDEIDLDCKVVAQCGESTECVLTETPTKPGFTAWDVFLTFGRDFTNGVMGAYDDDGYDPELAEQPTTYKVGDAIATLSSVRYSQAGVAHRAWFAQISAPFGVALMACYGNEDRYEASQPAWMALAKGVILPKN